MSLSAAELRIATAVAEAAIPAGRLLPAAGVETARRADAFVAALGPAAYAGWRALLWMIEAHGLATEGSRFSALPAAGRVKVLESWRAAEATRLMARTLLAPLKLAYFEAKEPYQALGCRYVVDPPPPRRERWHEQISDGAALGDGAELECDVVVVGTGAGGAPVAASLAEKGFAVLLLEEGAHHTRDQFNGRPAEAMRKLYRNGGVTIAYGNTGIPVPVGRAVGGTTVINSGTCLRPGPGTLAEWERAGLGGHGLQRYFEEVERELQVGPSSPAAIGKVGELIARGCDALGWSHHPLPRNAPGCDGQGLCCFGCPTEAKRSTNVSWIPRALSAGAQLLTGVKVTRVLLEGETAVGVVGVAGGKALRVRARAVVLACGSLSTPLLLLQQAIANASGEVGRNLSIHPATYALGLFDEQVHSWRSVPQGYAMDEFHREGLLYEGSSTPLEIQGTSLSLIGPAYTALMEEFDRTVSFGFLVKDTSRGRVRPGRDGEPLITYWVNEEDRRRLQLGSVLLARLYFAAGAREVVSMIAGFDRLTDLKQVAALEAARIPVRSMDLTAYHPLGTCRMGTDPSRSVVGPTGESHDVHNLYISDGSALPGSLGVNPQVTIMALGLRAAEHIARRVERLAARAA